MPSVAYHGTQGAQTRTYTNKDMKRKTKRTCTPTERIEITKPIWCGHSMRMENTIDGKKRRSVIHLQTERRKEDQLQHERMEKKIKSKAKPSTRTNEEIENSGVRNATEPPLIDR